MYNYFPKIFIKILIFLTPCFLLFSCASKNSLSPEGIFNDVVVFGDSLSDTGNFFAILDTVIDPVNSNVKIDVSSRPSANSGYAFSSGDLLVEHVANSYGIPLRGYYYSLLAPSLKRGHVASKTAINLSRLAVTHLIGMEAYSDKPAPRAVAKKYKQMAKKSLNLPLRNTSTGNNFAIAGAGATKNDPNVFKNTLSLDRQLNDFKNSAISKYLDYDKTLFIIFIGSNDIINLSFAKLPKSQIQRLLDSISVSIIAAVTDLQEAGAKKILVISPPDVSLSPFYNRFRYSNNNALLLLVKNASLYSLSVRDDLAEKISTDFTDGSVQFFDLYSQFTKKEFFQQLSNISSIDELLASYCFRTVDTYVKSSLSKIKIGINYHRKCNISDLNSNKYAFFDHLHPSPKIVKPLADNLLEFVNSKFGN